MLRRTPIVAAVLALAVAGCSSPQESATPAQATPTTSAEARDTAAVEMPTPTPPAEVPVGRAQVSEGADATLRVAVLRVRQPLPAVIPGLPERRGYEYAGVEVRTCVVKTAPGTQVGVSWSPWSLTDADGVVTEPLTGWSDSWWNVPLYPNGDHAVRSGRCVRGWIPFEVKKGSKQSYVSYQPPLNAPLEWVIS